MNIENWKEFQTCQASPENVLDYLDYNYVLT